ncbi:MAG: SIS domain-containing protein [Candidatus Lokiarchaeota archaeon]|nr:SIS domain-containing protein [Candidatus Lokiarchaeota archaeon]
MDSVEKPLQENHIDVFETSIRLLIDQGKAALNSVLNNADNFLDICKTLKEGMEEGKSIHITGMGRSGKAGMLTGELLKNIGFKVSYIGKTLARPIREGDIAIAFSGSGWTRETCADVDFAIRKGATILGVTSDLRSKIGRISDISIKLPGKKDIPEGSRYVTKQLEKIIATPLAPLGTVFELNVILFGAGLLGGLHSPSDFLNGYETVTKKMLQELDWTLTDLVSYQNNRAQLINVIKLFEDAIMHKYRTYWIGAGLTDIIAGMHAMRFQHLKTEVEQTYEWRFRENKDLLIAISGSGETPPVLHYASEAREIGMQVLGITAYMPSSLSDKCTHVLVVHGRDDRESAHNKRINSSADIFIPAFEYSAANILDGIAAQLAFNLGVSEHEMENEHA